MAIPRLIGALLLVSFVAMGVVSVLTFTPILAASISNGGVGATNSPAAPLADDPTATPGLPSFDLSSTDATATPTETIAPSEVISPSETVSSTNEVVLDLTYDECSPIEDEFIKVECTNGTLAFTRKETIGTRWIYYRPILTDAIIEVTVRLPSQKNARYGVIFRLDDTNANFYLLGVTNEGKYGLFRFGQDHYETLIPYTDSFNVGNASFPTKIKIVNQGDTIAINLGGEWVDSIRDPNLKEGRIALFVEPDEPDQTVLFDDLRVTAITNPVQVPTPRDVIPPTPTELPTRVPTVKPVATAIPIPTKTPQPTPTETAIILPGFFDTPTPAAPVSVQNVEPTPPPCPVGQDEAGLLINNNYIGQDLTFTIGGGAWGTHQFTIPGDGTYHTIRMPGGIYTYTAFIPRALNVHGDKTYYQPGECQYIRYSP
ncbi:MAG TPA: hypothetical protein VFD70_00155 [Anaerolineae bacterium]|nr:hypothetical protein [Anaerolineae bacterium]